ncbi:MAG: hypothetical protein ACE5GU_01145 [Candidatus Scalinduaceae bacterium]
MLSQGIQLAIIQLGKQTDLPAVGRKSKFFIICGDSDVDMKV